MKVDYLFNIVLVGGPNTGKSAMMSKYVSNKFTNHNESTIGLDFSTKIFQNVKLVIWDLSGNAKYQLICQKYYRGAHGALVFIDLTDHNSMNSIDEWIKSIYEEHAMPMMLIGTKSDLVNCRQISYEEAYKVAKMYGIEYVETSSANGHNIIEVFELMVYKILNKSGINKVK